MYISERVDSLQQKETCLLEHMYPNLARLCGELHSVAESEVDWVQYGPSELLKYDSLEQQTSFHIQRKQSSYMGTVYLWSVVPLVPKSLMRQSPITYTKLTIERCFSFYKRHCCQTLIDFKSISEMQHYTEGCI